MLTPRSCRAGAVLGRILLLATLVPRAAVAQTDRDQPREPPDARVALLPVALYTAQANFREASDSGKAGLATGVLQSRLRELLDRQLVAGPQVAAAAESAEARAQAGDQPCNVIVACARRVGERLHAHWVVMAKVSKTSNLIWLLTGQLIQVSSGVILLDDSTELKGEPERMIRAGVRIFAERVARAVRNGGAISDFPAVQ